METIFNYTIFALTGIAIWLRFTKFKTHPLKADIIELVLDAIGSTGFFIFTLQQHITYQIILSIVFFVMMLTRIRKLFKFIDDIF